MTSPWSPATLIHTLGAELHLWLLTGVFMCLTFSAPTFIYIYMRAHSMATSIFKSSQSSVTSASASQTHLMLWGTNLSACWKCFTGILPCAGCIKPINSCRFFCELWDFFVLRLSCSCSSQRCSAEPSAGSWKKYKFLSCFRSHLETTLYHRAMKRCTRRVTMLSVPFHRHWRTLL